MYIFIFCLFLLFSPFLSAKNLGIVNRPDAHAPIGIMGDHIHKKGEVMLSYRYMRMEMSDLQDASHNISRDDAVSTTGSYKFMNAPIKMHSNMHMFGGMYGINNSLTGMIMIPFINKKMQIRQRAGDLNRFTVSSRGLGDIKLTGLYKLKEKKIPLGF